ncbi:hypothetical protein [Argonema galeatum]|uniref:hypothetical protein n=1 Tax=Argonema galeatum TaxID=2942762 RepID=UPI0020111313|nr:hypothetical protein [Argonema galeatum]MCL1464082.1 hypothetical protein [Argonema galeatum A003/A1]
MSDRDESREIQNQNGCLPICGILILNVGLFFLIGFLFSHLSILFPNLPFIITKCLYPQTYNNPLANGFANIQAVFGSISIVQIFYLIPLIYWLKRKRKKEFVKGVIIGAVITALLTSPCFIQVIACKSYS